jgi:hypothetical protein
MSCRGIDIGLHWAASPGNEGSTTAILVFYTAAVLLIVMAIWIAFTGARTSILPMKACPFGKTYVAILFILAAAL